MNDIYFNYCCPNGKYPQVARFLTIYLEEAHARDEWWLPDSPDAKVEGKSCIMNHKTLADRVNAAKQFVTNFNFPSEMVVDTFKEQVNERFDSWPERLYIIQDGRVVYKGGMGPFNYRLAEVKDWLAEKYGLRGETISRR